MSRVSVMLQALLSRLHALSIVCLLCALETTAQEHCRDITGRFVLCAGYCCPTIGCCSFGSLWYAWLLVALVILLCMCACMGCGAKRYYATNNIRNTRQRLRFIPHLRENQQQQQPMGNQFRSHYRYQGVVNNNAPPPYSTATPPPPYQH